MDCDQYKLLKSQLWLVITLIMFIAFSGCNESKWDRLNNKAIDLYNQAKYDEGLQVAKKALEVAEQKYGNDHANIATSLNTLASFYDSKKEYDQAESLYKKALKIQEKVLDSNNPDTAITLNNLAYLYYSKKLYDEAEPLYKRALDIRDKNFKDNIDVANSLNNLATLYHMQHRDLEAKPLFERLVDIQKKNLGNSHPDIEKTQNIISSINQDIDNHNKAMNKAMKAVALSQGFLSFSDECAKISCQTTCRNSKVISAAQMYYCAQGKTETVNWYINGIKGTDRVQNIKLMWNDWYKDFGYGIHAEKKEAFESLEILINLYASDKSKEIKDAFCGNKNITIKTKAFMIKYTFDRGAGIDERLITITELEDNKSKPL